MSIATVAIAAADESLALCVGLGSGGVSSSSCGGRKGRRRRPRSGGGWVWVCLLAGLGLPRALLVWLRVYRVRNEAARPAHVEFGIGLDHNTKILLLRNKEF